MADCTSGQTSLQDGRQFVEPVDLSRCEKVNALISDKSAKKFKLSCNKTNFKCMAYECQSNLAPDKNGICSTAVPSDQARFHKGLLTYIYQKRNFFDACLSFVADENQNKTVVETQSEIKELGKKIKYACVTDFATYKLSTALAIGLVERYNWSNNIGRIRADNCTIQQNNRFKSGGGRSIRCVSDNGVFVEFLFGKMDSLSTSREDVAGALCPAFGFKAMEANGMRHFCHLQNKKSYKDLATFLQQSELMDIKNAQNNYFEIIPLQKDIEKNDKLSKILYTDEFKDVITNATTHIKLLLKEYIEQRLKAAGYEIESIKFYSARSDSFSTVQGSTWPVEIFACKKNDCKSYIKLFKFRSLFGSPGVAELHFASWTSLSVEQMSCLIKDGLFDSKHCFFLEEDISNEKKQCTNTNNLIQNTFPNGSAKAEFDAEDNMCVLNSSSKNAKTLKALGIAAQVGMLVVTTIVTAGTGSVLGIGLAAGGLLADGVTLAADIEMNKASLKFLKLSTRCYDADCAKKYFEDEFKHMLQLMDRINDDEFNVIDSEMDRLVKLLDDKYIGDTYANGLAKLKEDTTGLLNNMSTEEKIEAIATIVSLALSVTSATKGVKAMISKSKTRAPKFLKRLDIRINQCPTCKKGQIDELLSQRQLVDLNKTTKTAGKFDDVADMSKMGKAGKWADATVLDPTFDIKVTPLELGGKKYYLKSGDTESLIQNEISRTKQAHELLKRNKIVTSVGVVEDDQTVLKAFMDAHPDITLPRTPDTQYFIMEATHANTVEGLSDAEILGYLRNKPITIEEQNTILSEIQNMNNNGLIHNDIWHNFAIYRDSGGKLHMELMDFGDFTAEDKLLRSNDDVLEIKKLFSRWSDRGLVEKATPVTPVPKPTTTTSSGTTAKPDIGARFNLGGSGTTSEVSAKTPSTTTTQKTTSKTNNPYGFNM